MIAALLPRNRLRTGLRNVSLSDNLSHRGLARPRLASEDPMQLRLSTRSIDGILIVDCAGRIVFGEESAILRDTVRKLIKENSKIVLNLGGISYIDSGGLGTLVSLYTTAQNAGGSVKLANLTQRVGDLLQVTKLVTIFEVFDSEDKAVQSFRKGAAA
jgi:anti-sigma B factor antagonist